jgi:hypothetical protein
MKSVVTLMVLLNYCPLLSTVAAVIIMHLQTLIVQDGRLASPFGVS